jgi:hypothetical protein
MKVCEMQNANTIFAVMRSRGEKGQPVERLYRMLFNQELYLRAYAKLYPNQGAMTPGATLETADEMSLEKANSIIEAIRHERYSWTPVKRTYIKKANGKLRPLGLPMWRSHCTSYSRVGYSGCKEYKNWNFNSVLHVVHFGTCFLPALPDRFA